MQAPDVDLDAPALCDVETASGLRAAVLHKKLSVARAAEALKDYEDLPLRLHGHRPLLQRIFELRENFSPYDAVYVALAERLDAGLLTADERLERAVLKHTSIRLVRTASKP